MNSRANIMYFIEHLCDMSQKENHLDFVRMMQRDILRVVDAVAPSDGSGAANVKVVRRVRVQASSQYSRHEGLTYVSGTQRPPAKGDTRSRNCYGNRSLPQRT